VTEHAAAVDAWLARRAEGASRERLVEALDEAFGALWRRGLLTLGEVTLGAIADRVLVVASGRFPILSPLRVAEGGLACEGLRDRASELSPAELTEAIRFVLVELLTVVGDLTAEILTPALHAELARIAAPARPRSQDRPEESRRGARRGQAASS
jgi:hypothetical protein